MRFRPPLRNYRQMIRIVRDKAGSSINFKMGNAYGKKTGDFSSLFAGDQTPTELQIRTLNELEMPSTSIRRPEPPAVDGFLPNRESSTLFHSVNSSTQKYLNGQGGSQATKRQDDSPGTKLRTSLDHDASNTTVYTQEAIDTSPSHNTKQLAKDSSNHHEALKKTDKTFTAFE